MGKLVCINIDGSITQRDNVKSLYQSQVYEKKSFAFASMDVLLEDRHVESLYQGQVNDFFCVHSGLPQR